jgi:hypothetical protein
MAAADADKLVLLEHRHCDARGAAEDRIGGGVSA